MQTNIRKRVLSTRKYTPQWKGFVEGFIVNFLRANYWRVASHMEYQDCTQEAHYTFLRLKAKYGNLDTPQHFMALFRTTWVNEFNDMAARDGKLKQLHAMDYLDSEVTDLIGDTGTDGDLAIMIEQAPSEIKMVLSLFITAPVEVLDMFALAWKERGKHKEFGNNHLNEMFGLPEKTDLVGMIYSYFGK